MNAVSSCLSGSLGLHWYLALEDNPEKAHAEHERATAHAAMERQRGESSKEYGENGVYSRTEGERF